MKLIEKKMLTNVIKVTSTIKIIVVICEVFIKCGNSVKFQEKEKN